MKKSELLQIIKEEIQDAFKKDSPKAKYKKGDKINYRGTSYTVKSDNGYVVTGTDTRGNEKTFNYNQLSQGMVAEESKEKEFTFSYTYRGGRGGDDEYDAEITVTAPDKETARDKAWEKVKGRPVIGQKAGLR